MNIICCSSVEDNDINCQQNVFNDKIITKVNEIINNELDNDLIESLIPDIDDDLIIKSQDTSRINHNEFCNIFNKTNFINFEKEILDLCKNNKIVINQKSVDDDLLKLLSIFTSSEFKENLETEDQLNILEKVTNIIINTLLYGNKESVLNQTANLFNSMQTWILNKPNLKLQNDVEYLSQMINFVLDNKLNENFAEEFDLCYSAVLRSFDSFSLKINSKNNDTENVISNNYEYFIDYLIHNKTLEKIGLMCETLYNQNDYNTSTVISDLMPLLCKNILFAHENFYKILFKYKNILVDLDNDKILPVGMALLSSFIYEKQYNTETFKFINNLLIDKIKTDINSCQKNKYNIEFISFIKILEQYFEY